jgi:hypothetical protein
MMFLTREMRERTHRRHIKKRKPKKPKKHIMFKIIKFFFVPAKPKEIPYVQTEMCKRIRREVEADMDWL